MRELRRITQYGRTNRYREHHHPEPHPSIP